MPKSRDAVGCEYDQGAEDAVMVSCDAEMIQFHSQMEKMKLQKRVPVPPPPKKSAYPFRGEEKKWPKMIKQYLEVDSQKVFVQSIFRFLLIR